MVRFNNNFSIFLMRNHDAFNLISPIYSSDFSLRDQTDSTFASQIDYALNRIKMSTERTAAVHQCYLTCNILFSKEN